MTLDPHIAQQIADRFGVAVEQVRRDHLISHLLGTISENADRVIFYGGTALARTHLPDGRLSEDIDLIAVASRAEVAVALDIALERATRRSHGPAAWSPALSAVRSTEPASISTGALRVRIQLLAPNYYPPWPTEIRELDQRYPDAPPARLTVPTLASFVAWKTAAWQDRHAARDLWDLWALSQRGAITSEAGGLFAEFAAGYRPKEWMFQTPPTEAAWRSELSGQTRLEVSAAQALTQVRIAWRQAAGD
jgi:predicted nucleotidyltransferase component of viral defense system